MIPVTIHREIFRLPDDPEEWMYEDYDLPPAFGPGDGLVRFVMRPTREGYHTHAVRLLGRKAVLEDEAGLQMLETQALVLTSHAYRQQYGIGVEKTETYLHVGEDE